MLMDYLFPIQVLHQIFRRNEPRNALSAIVTLASADAALYVAFRRFEAIPLEYAQSSVLGIIGVSMVVALLLSIAIYRLSPWHPLAQFPGPVDHKLTKIRTAYSSWRGVHFKNVKKMHDKYGPVVRVGSSWSIHPSRQRSHAHIRWLSLRPK